MAMRSFRNAVRTCEEGSSPEMKRLLEENSLSPETLADACWARLNQLKRKEDP